MDSNKRHTALTLRPLLLDTLSSPNKHTRPPCSAHELPIQPALAPVSAQDARQRQLCVSYICRMRAYRARLTRGTARLAA
jgi:hypothetical protein